MQRKTTLVSPRGKATPWTRRALLGALIGFYGAAPWLGRLQARDTGLADQDPSADPIRIEWELPRRNAARTAEYLGVGSDHIVPAPGSPVGRGGPLIVIIVAAVLLVVLARALVAAYRDFRYGGLIIQDTDRGLSVRSDRRIPGHVIIIKDRNGVTIRELRGDEVNVRDLVPLLASARGVPAR